MVGPVGEPPSRFITLEGIEGVGKSTHAASIADWLRAAGGQVVVTREPGGVPVAERIRDLLLEADGVAPGAMTELLLMFGARAAHLEGLIWPALDAGQWVVCDRFTDATYAYQGGGRGIPAAAIATLENLVQGDFRPGLTLLLDADWDTTLARRHQRGVRDRFEDEDRQFFDRVRSIYLDRAYHEPHRFRVIDARFTLEEVRARVTDAVQEFTKNIIF